jgi:hypothetical protein
VLVVLDLAIQRVRREDDRVDDRILDVVDLDFEAVDATSNELRR